MKNKIESLKSYLISGLVSLFLAVFFGPHISNFLTSIGWYNEPFRIVFSFIEEIRNHSLYPWIAGFVIGFCAHHLLKSIATKLDNLANNQISSEIESLDSVREALENTSDGIIAFIENHNLDEINKAMDVSHINSKDYQLKKRILEYYSAIDILFGWLRRNDFAVPDFSQIPYRPHQLRMAADYFTTIRPYIRQIQLDKARELAKSFCEKRTLDYSVPF